MEPFIDSEMTFGPYPATSHGFRVDGSTPHEAAGKGVKMIDFYKLDQPVGKAPKLWLVEAKKSTPNFNSPIYSKAIKALEIRRDQAMSEDHRDVINTLIGLVETQGPILSPVILSDCDIYIDDIRAKIHNGLSLFFSTRAGRQPKHVSSWPAAFMSADTGQLQVRILLIIKTAEERWLPDLRDELIKAMRPAIGTWALGPDSIVVLNENGARQRGFVSHHISS
jgi:hypothetical protein